jgi:hypothetical protein
MKLVIRPNEIVPTKRKYRVPRTRSHYAKKFWAKVKIGKPDECWPWQRACDEHGYGHTWNGLRELDAHQMAWWLVHGELPLETPCVLHSCDNRPCCNPSHLFAGTKKDNTVDMVKKGRARGGSNKGESHPNRKLTNADVLKIRKDFKPGYGKTAAMARIYGVSATVIYFVVRRKSWKHI